ncbi:hypothetical protein LCGC14_3051590, partial [marine sediment metagenome]
QPFHRGHYSVYKHLVDRFGAENVFIGTSDKVNMPKSPFSFAEKEKVMTGMFDIPTDKVRQVKSPFAPEEILDDFDSETTTFVTAFSEKDAGRLSKGKYYKELGDKDPSDLEGYRDRGYFIVAPVFKLDIAGKNISGTQIRSVLGNPKTSSKAKAALFQKLSGQESMRCGQSLSKSLAHTLDGLYTSYQPTECIVTRTSRQSDMARISRK